MSKKKRNYFILTKYYFFFSNVDGVKEYIFENRKTELSKLLVEGTSVNE